MDLHKLLLEEHSKAQAHKIAAYIGQNPTRFKNLVDLYLSSPYRVTQRAAWALSLCVERNPLLIMPHLKSTLNFLEKPGVHNAVKRNSLRLLQFIVIPKKYHGQVAQTCFNFLQSKKEPVAIKAFSMTVLCRILKDEPVLQNELRIIIEDQMHVASPGFLSRGRKVLKELGG